MHEDYKEAVKDFYASAALAPDSTLCCVEGTLRHFPDIHAPDSMLEMNYGCGSTVLPQDLTGVRPILYVGVGGGLEALQFSYFRRRPGGVIAVEPVAEMREAAARNLEEAARRNAWFRPEFVHIVNGSAQTVPVTDESVDVVAQNCLFNIFADGDLRSALSEVHRVLAPGGRFSTSDPITTASIPESLKRNNTLRARCCSGCQTYEEYIDTLDAAGFRQIVVRARVPYRLLAPSEFPELDRPILLESLEVLALKAGVDSGRASEGAEVYTGRYAIHRGTTPHLHARGFTFVPGNPVPVSDRLAAELAGRPDFLVTASTYHARSPGCC